MASEVGSAGLGLVPAAKDRPAQAVGDGVFAVANEVEQSTDFGEGERDKVAVDGWRGVRFGRFAGWIVVVV